MFRIIYLSAASHLFSKSELVALLEKSRVKNARLGITGILLYRDGDFLQLLEGEETAVRQLYRQIEADARHTAVTSLIEEQCEERLFADWSMGFRDLADPALAKLPGFSDLMNKSFAPQALKDHPENAMQLISVFVTPGRR